MKNISLENDFLIFVISGIFGDVWFENVLSAVFRGLESVTQGKWTVND